VIYVDPSLPPSTISKSSVLRKGLSLISSFFCFSIYVADYTMEEVLHTDRRWRLSVNLSILSLSAARCKRFRSIGRRFYRVTMVRIYRESIEYFLPYSGIRFYNTILFIHPCRVRGKASSATYEALLHTKKHLYEIRKCTVKSGTAHASRLHSR